MSSSIGIIIPNIWKVIKMFQTTNQSGLIPMTFPFSNGFPMVFPWFSHGFPMIYGDLWSWWFKSLIPSDSRGNTHPAANFLKGIATINRRNQHRVSCLETNLAIVNHVESPSLVAKPWLQPAPQFLLGRWMLGSLLTTKYPLNPY